MLGLINQREVHILNQDDHVRIEPLNSIQDLDILKSIKFLSISRKFVLFPGICVCLKVIKILHGNG